MTSFEVEHEALQPRLERFIREEPARLLASCDDMTRLCKVRAMLWLLPGEIDVDRDFMVKDFTMFTVLRAPQKPSMMLTTQNHEAPLYPKTLDEAHDSQTYG